MLKLPFCAMNRVHACIDRSHVCHVLAACTNIPGCMRREQFRRLAEQLTPEQQERLRNKILVNKLKSKRVRVQGKRVGSPPCTTSMGNTHGHLRPSFAHVLHATYCVSCCPPRSMFIEKEGIAMPWEDVTA